MKTVFTNGCFDIVHIGHISLLEYSKSLGDKLIVAINSDKSIQKLKGKDRPINNESDRKKFLESIKWVDEVIIFDDETPIDIINSLKPSIIVKGGDYKKEDVVGFHLEKQGISSIIIFPTINGKSTTSIWRKIKDDLCG
jgi:rfaE bifunctional protein nucleotidyltransferase chain/domain